MYAHMSMNKSMHVYMNMIMHGYACTNINVNVYANSNAPCVSTAGLLYKNRRMKQRMIEFEKEI